MNEIAKCGLGSKPWNDRTKITRIYPTNPPQKNKTPRTTSAVVSTIARYSRAYVEGLFCRHNGGGREIQLQGILGDLKRPHAKLLQIPQTLLSDGQICNKAAGITQADQIASKFMAVFISLRVEAGYGVSLMVRASDSMGRRQSRVLLGACMPR